jgi:histidyl-tRNA synthetase
VKLLREHGISCELYHEKSKFDRQFKYAEKKNIPYIGIIGEEELKTGTIMVKELASGVQVKMNINELLAKLSGH